MGRIIDVLTTGSLVLSVLAAGTSVVYRTFAPQRPSAGADTPPTRMRKWKEAVALGQKVSGPDSARTTVAVFGDLQCPACRSYHTLVLEKVMEHHPNDVRILLLHNPLPYHRFALPAARAMGCITDEASLQRWMHVIYTKQDSLGIKSWSAFAKEAKLARPEDIERCATDSLTRLPIDETLRFSQGIVDGTPTVAINGWLFSRLPRLEQIDSVIRKNSAH